MSYRLWKAEKANPTPEDRRGDRSTEPLDLLGYWRIQGARSKPDYPLAIWAEKDGDSYVEPVIFQIGRKMPMNTEQHRQEWDELMAGSWLKCVAVEKADWDIALETGRWPPEPDYPEGKTSRQPTPEEKAGITTIKETPPEQGGNWSPDAEEDDEEPEVDEFYVQIKTKLEQALADAAALGPITTLETANKAAKIIETIADNGTLGENRRKEEKKPWDDGAAAVQEKWVPVLKPASEKATELRKLIQKFRDDEEARLREEARLKREADEKRLAEEAAQRIADEAAQRSLQTGEAAPTEEEIAAQAAAEAAQQMDMAPEANTTVRVGTAQGRGVGVAKKKVGIIEDVDKFIAAIRPKDGAGQPLPFDQWPESSDFKAWLQDKANKLARANTAFDGMKLDKV